mgnify:CR=1 FL=1
MPRPELRTILPSQSLNHVGHFVLWIPIFGLLFLLGMGVTVLLFSKPGTANQLVSAPQPITSVQSFNPAPLTYSDIFSEEKTWIATLSAERVRTILVTGDVMPGRSVNIYTKKIGNVLWPYENVARVMQSADLTVVNLETPFIENCPERNSGFTFCAEANNVEGLLSMGTDVVSVANNHALNHGITGLTFTDQLLQSNGIAVTGITNPTLVPVRGRTISFLGYTDVGPPVAGIAYASEERLTREIREANEKSDIVIVFFHWGNEYTHTPGARQRMFGRTAIDLGADLVVGAHPHWVQEVELYKDKLIAYSHGNFVFDQGWSEETRRGVVGKYTFYDERLINAEFLPIRIADYGQPSFISDKTIQKQILDSMKPSLAK